MLTELEKMQESDENVWGIDLSFDVESRTEDGDEIVHKTYTFSWAKEWDEWLFTEFYEKRTKDADLIQNRNWRKSRHIMWHDVNETPTIDVPPEISQALEDATGAEEVTIRGP